MAGRFRFSAFGGGYREPLLNLRGYPSDKYETGERAISRHEHPGGGQTSAFGWQNQPRTALGEAFLAKTGELACFPLSERISK